MLRRWKNGGFCLAWYLCHLLPPQPVGLGALQRQSRSQHQHGHAQYLKANDTPSTSQNHAGCACPLPKAASSSAGKEGMIEGGELGLHPKSCSPQHSATVAPLGAELKRGRQQCPVAQAVCLLEEHGGWQLPRHCSLPCTLQRPFYFASKMCLVCFLRLKNTGRG